MKSRPARPEKRSDRIFRRIWIMGEGKGEGQYFDVILYPGVEFKALPRHDDNRSCPNQVAEKAVKSFEESIKKERDHALQIPTEVWVVIDVDQHKHRQHKEAQRICDREGFKIAISNPCFEVWLLHHLEELPESFKSELKDTEKGKRPKKCIERLNQLLGKAYQKTRLQPEIFLGPGKLREAIERSRTDHQEWEPPLPGTYVYKIFNHLDIDNIRLKEDTSRHLPSP